MRAADTPRQGGIALLLVLVLLLLSGLTVLGAARVIWLNETLVGGAVDYQRAFTAAEAVLRDAESDVLGVLADGSACGATRCRAAVGSAVFPNGPADMVRLADAVAASPDVPCQRGICLPKDADQLGDIQAWPPGMSATTRALPAFAAYGSFTGAPTDDDPYLKDRAMYWVEVYDYATGHSIVDGGSSMQPDAARPYVFRITAVVSGLRPGTRVALSEIFVPSPWASNS